MSSASRRSVRVKAGEKHVAEESLQKNNTPARVTRRSSVQSLSSTMITSKSVVHSRKKLGTNDILNELESSSDEEIIDNSNNNKKIVMRLKRLSDKHTYKSVENTIDTSQTKNLKSRKSQPIRNTSTESSLRDRSRRRTTVVNYNIESLMEKAEEQSRLEMILNDKMTPKKSVNQTSKHKDTEKVNITGTRKRSVQIINFSDQEDFEQDDLNDEDEIIEVDENKMHNANLNISPKRLKSGKTLKSTPSKLNSRTPSKSSLRSSKISLETPTKAFKELNLNDKFSTPRTSTAIVALKSDTPSKKIDQKAKTPKRLTYQSSEDKDSKKTKKICTRNESMKSVKTYEDDNLSADEFSESVDESEYEVEKDEASEDSTDNHESEDSELELFSKRQKVAKQGLTTSKKTPTKSNLRTPSKNLRTPSKNLRTPSRSLRTPSKNLKTPSKISMDTPTKALSRLNLKNSLTPSVHQRSANIAKPTTPLQEARLKLHVSVLPKSLPCREEQFNDIYTFLSARLSDCSGGCIYISGVPGTGKTATVNEVIRCLKKSMNAGNLTSFKFIDINGMKLSEPRQAYVQIWKQLTGKTTTWEEAQKLLHDRFTKSDSKQDMTLLLVDELDLLCTKRQDVVYNLLDWPSKSGAKLVVVTIANTMDLPERILMGKVTSRLGLTRLTFPPYNYKQLEEIVVSRLKGYNAFRGETVQLVARKVAAVSGDARRALDICRRATEVAESNGREMVSMLDVKQALDEMIASPKIQAIKHCSDFEKIFLQAVCTEVNRTGVEEVVFKNVLFQLGTLCTFSGMETPNVTEALSMCARLGSWRLLLCDHSRMDIHQRLLLNVSTDDVHFATQAIEA